MRVLGLVLGLLVAAAWRPEARLPLALTVVLAAVLLTGPSWFLHYPGSSPARWRSAWRTVPPR